MIKNGCIINGYVVLAIANGITLAYSETAPDPYVVWRITADGSGVWSGYYTNTREDAERNFASKAFEWFEDNTAERIDSFNWHFDEASERIETCRNILDEIQQEIDNAAALVEDMVAEHEKLVGEKNAPQEEIAEQPKVACCAFRNVKLKCSIDLKKLGKV